MRKLFFLILVCCTSCEQTIELDLPKGYKRLVVEGWITDQPGPYVVKLTKTSDYSFTYNDTVVFEKGAEVVIKDNTGTSVLLTEVSPGTYQTDSLSDFVGEEGKSYTLEIKTSEGTEYVSRSELLKAVPQIDTIIYFMDLNVRDAVGNPYMEAHIKFQDPAEERNFYLVKEIFYVDKKLDNSYSDVYSDRFVNGNKPIIQVLGPYDQDYRAHTIFSLVAELQSLSKEADQFWILVKSQTEDIGSPYDPPSAPIYGNIDNVKDPKNYALGYFGASATSRSREIIVDPNQ